MIDAKASASVHAAALRIAGELGGFGPPENRGPNGREYHTDWPHDLSDRGKFATGGPIRQPFPDGEPAWPSKIVVLGSVPTLCPQSAWPSR